MRQNIEYDLSPHTESPVPDEQVDNDALNIQVDDALLAAAVASVEQIQRDAKRVSAVDMEPPLSAESVSAEVSDAAEEPAASAAADTDPAQTFDDPLKDALDEEVEIDIELEEFDPDEETVIDTPADEEVVLLRRLLEASQTELKNAQQERERSLKSAGKLRKEVLRLRAEKQRSRDRLDTLKQQLRQLEEARLSVDSHNKQLQEASNRYALQLQHIQVRRKQEKEEQLKFGHSNAVTAILPVIDHLQMAMKHAAADPQDILNGVQMVLSQFESALSSVGVTAIPSAPGTPFDPSVHEAFLHVPTDTFPERTIFEQITAGYSLNGRLLRAARVSVAAPPPAPAPSEEDDTIAPDEADERAPTPADAVPELTADAPASTPESCATSEGHEPSVAADPDAPPPEAHEQVLVTDEDAQPNLEIVTSGQSTETHSAPDAKSRSAAKASESRGHSGEEE